MVGDSNGHVGLGVKCAKEVRGPGLEIPLVMTSSRVGRLLRLLNTCL